jgi:hypothetical protein
LCHAYGVWAVEEYIIGVYSIHSKERLDDVKGGYMGAMAAVILSVAMQVAPTASAPGSAPPRAEGQTIQGTDQADAYVIGNDKGRTKVLGEVRDFLWNRWQQHRAGQLKVTWISKEGESSDSKFVLEYDDHGVWSIGVTIDRPALKDSPNAHTEYRIYSVQRVKLPGADADIRDVAQVPGTAFLLVLKDADGKKKTQI